MRHAERRPSAKTQHLAKRLVYFSKGLEGYTHYPAESIRRAEMEGKVAIGGLEFKFSEGKDKKLNVEVRPLNELEDWTKLREHLKKIEDPEYWGQDNYRESVKIRSNKYKKEFLEDFNEEMGSGLEESLYKISTTLKSGNEDKLYQAVLNCVVRPLILYDK